MALRLTIDATRRYLALVGSALRPGRNACVRPTPRHYLVTLPLLALLPLFAAYHWLGLLLDEILFRGYRRVPVRAPLFVLGVPRSGTTALHHALASDTRLTTWRTWECLFATSVTWRWCWHGMGRLDRLLGGPGRRGLQRLEALLLGRIRSVHAIALDSPEEDYLALMPALGCFVLIVLGPDAAALWRLGRFDRDLPAAQRAGLMRMYHRAVQRHLYFHGSDRQFLAKNASFTPAVASLLETFPDARILACVRAPDGALASQLNALDPTLRALHGDYRRTVLRERFIATFDYHYRHLFAVLARQPRGCAVLIPSRALDRDLASTITHALRELGLSVPPAFARHLAALNTARSRASGARQHDLGRFDTSTDAIQARFADIHAAFDFAAPRPIGSHELVQGHSAKTSIAA